MDASLSVKVPADSTQKKNYPTFSPAALPIKTKLNEFVITEVIGEGGFGIVYAAQDERLQRTVAIKEYMPAAIASRHTSSHVSLRSERHKDTFSAGLNGFIEEARLLAQFKHPALVEIFTFWQANGTAYMVMPNYQGDTLKKSLKKNPHNADERWLKAILNPILSALELLHEKQIYHRDIAPDNIVIQHNGQPVLLDLGSARRVISGMQQALTVVVKPGYAPIEQYTDDTVSEQGPWTDIYAIGAVIYFVITGRAPNASVSRMMKDTLPALSREQYPNFSDEFLAAVNQALMLQPHERQQSIAELRDSLNIASMLSENIANTTPHTAAHTTQTSVAYDDDDGKTVILSEDEVEALQHQLLAPASTPAEQSPSEQELPPQENPLKAPEPNTDTSKSSFDDVKELLDGTDRSGTYQMQISEPDASAQAEQKAEPQSRKTNAIGAWFVGASKTLKLQMAVLAAAVVAALAAIAIAVLGDAPPTSPTVAKQANSVTPTEPTPSVPPSNTGVTAYNATHVETASALSEPFSPITTPVSTLTPVNSTQPPVVLAQITPIAEENPKRAPAEENNKTNETETVTPAPEKTKSQELTEKTVTESQSTTSPAPQNKGSNAILSTASVKKGQVKLSVIPWGEIWIDDKKYGVSPPLTSISLPEGSHRLEIRSPGMQTKTQQLEISADHTISIKHTLKNASASNASTIAATESVQGEPRTIPTDPIKETSANTNTATEQPDEHAPEKTVASVGPWSINLRVQPWGEVWIDGEQVGVAPPLRELTLNKQQHYIQIINPSYPVKEIRVEHDADSDTTINHIFN